MTGPAPLGGGADSPSRCAHLEEDLNRGRFPGHGPRVANGPVWPALPQKSDRFPGGKSSTDIPGACGARARIPDRHAAGVDRIVSGFGKGSVSVCGSAREPAGSGLVCGRRVPAVSDGVGPRREMRRAKSDRVLRNADFGNADFGFAQAPRRLATRGPEAIVRISHPARATARSATAARSLPRGRQPDFVSLTQLPTAVVARRGGVGAAGVV